MDIEKMKAEKDVEGLINALKDKDKNVRSDAAGALGQIKDVRAVDPLIRTLKDKEGSVRYIAALALGEIKDVRAAQPLIQALKDKDEAVRLTATEVLRKIKDARGAELPVQIVEGKGLPNLPEEVIVKPAKRMFDFDSFVKRDVVLCAGFYLSLDDIQKQSESQNGFLKQMDILIEAVARAQYRVNLTVWGAHVPTWQGICYGIFITPQRTGQHYSKILREIEKFVIPEELTSRTEMPDNAIPLLTWLYPSTITRYWERNFEIPEFYEQVNHVPRDEHLFFTAYEGSLEPKSKKKIGDYVLEIRNAFYRLSV